MGNNGKLRRGPLLLGIALGLLVFVMGAGAAGIFLPEWRAGQPLPEGAFRNRYATMAAKAGFRLAPGEPRVRLVIRDPTPYRGFSLIGTAGQGAGMNPVRVEVFHKVEGPESDRRGRLGIDFDLGGRPLALTWWSPGMDSLLASGHRLFGQRFTETLASPALAPGESLGPPRTEIFGGYFLRMYPIIGSHPPEHLLVGSPGNVMVGRLAGPLNEESVAKARAFMAHGLSALSWTLFAFAAVAAVFLVLLLQSRIGIANGAALALLALLTLSPVPTHVVGWISSTVGLMAVKAAWIFLLWSSAESLLRVASPEFTTSLDALRAGRLGPRGGRGILLGVAFGAAVAGLHLGLNAVAAALPGAQPANLTLHLPVSQAWHSPVADGINLAAVVALALALSLRLLPVRWAPWAAVLAAAAVLTPAAMGPWPAALAVNAAMTGVLVHVARRHGLTALLIASEVSLLLPPALFAALHFSWLPGTLVATAGLPAALVALGLLALRRSAQAEVQRLAPPAFVRRLAEEKRLKSEMGLLARMQRGLLPRTLPRVEGWEIAARSVLANEAGGDLYDFLPDDNGHLWIAAGDVAGHGYSCAVAQAMTKAALASLVGRGGRTPAEVLKRADRVLRAAGATRNFTALTLLRLEPRTGEALIANAGHPFPLLAASGRVSELALGGLPLGKGPARDYEDRPLSIPPGSVLVFSSDGLFEAEDRSGSPYGFERAQEVLRKFADRPAERILEAFFGDWRSHLRGQRPLDDTTLVVIKRLDRGAPR
jgi:serine phosphatase RsbU (regulator of sigma subunit)